jgi:agmatine deiminase
MQKILLFIPLCATLMFTACGPKDPDGPAEVDILYTMPEESAPHEGTWLQWPHEHQYGASFRDGLDATWVAMTAALVQSEHVHIIAYDATARDRITGLLTAGGVPLTNVDFKIYKTDDVWVRDNGPIYVRDLSGTLVLEDWGFNGWGKKADFKNCDAIPAKIAADQGITRVDVSDFMVVEGGAYEIDGNGTFLATKSAILNRNRNPRLEQGSAEAYFKKYLGVTHFIWLEGVPKLEITDMHIDGFARFANASTIITMAPSDLLRWDVPQSDIDLLYAAQNAAGAAYTFVQLPLTQNNVVTTAGTDLGYQGSYINYYIANTRVLVPNYNDPNDAVANAQIQALYPTRVVVGIDVRNLYENGGMVHCVTQQQPL